MVIIEQKIDISIIVPLYNEEANITLLLNKILENIKPICKQYEIIFIDDGSTDSTLKYIKEINSKYSFVRYISFRKNFGKAKALDEGFKLSQGNFVFTMDGDLQDDPREFIRFIDKMNQGYDVVSGWKFRRYDPSSKLFFSKIFNGLTSFLTGVKLHDFNCGFKLYKKEVIKSVKLYGEFHRFIPVLAHLEGFKIGEIKVRHHERKFGKSKYGYSRLFKGFFDLITIKFLLDFSKKPMHLFGFFGLIILVVGFILGLILAYYNIFHGISIIRPLLFLAIIFIVVGVQSFSLGLLGEMILFFNERQSNKIIKVNKYGKEFN